MPAFSFAVHFLSFAYTVGSARETITLAAVDEVPPVRTTAAVPAAFAFRQTSRSCENVCGILSPSRLNMVSFVKMPAGATCGTKPNSLGPYLPYAITCGEDRVRFAQGLFGIPAR